MLTTKKVIYRGIAEELQRKNVRVWDGNSSRAFLESMGLNHREEGDFKDLSMDSR